MLICYLKLQHKFKTFILHGAEKITFPKNISEGGTDGQLYL